MPNSSAKRLSEEFLSRTLLNQIFNADSPSLSFPDRALFRSVFSLVSAEVSLLICFLRSHIKVAVQCLNAQPHCADSFCATYRSPLKFFAFLEETNLSASAMMLSVILRST